MAHSKQTRLTLRSTYINEQCDLKEAAKRLGVSLPTAQRWKSIAKTAGDDWDTARNSLLLAQGGKKELMNQVLEKFFTQSERIFESIEKSENLKPEDMVSLMAKWTDSMSKVSKLLGTSNDFNKIGFALELLQKLGSFVKDHYPQHADAFLEILEPFGQEVSKEYG